MAKIPKFCPECGAELGGKPVCEKCGFDTKITEEKSMSSDKSGGSKSTWETLEPIVSITGKWAWLYGVIVGVLYIILSIWAFVTISRAIAYWESIYGTSIPYTGRGYGYAVWELITAVVSIAVSLLWVKPKFSIPCGEKDWEKLLTDVVKIGDIQIPWMLIMGVILAIFGYGWGGLAVLGCAIILIFFGPRKYEWKV
jgi:hypothetical protein